MPSYAVMVHIVGGGVALLAGAAALSARKGGALHQRTGTVFFLAMLVMAGSGALIAAFKPERGTAVVGIFTLYLAATSWAAATRRNRAGGLVEWAGFFVALACAAAFSAFSVLANLSDNGRLDSLPAAAHYPFAFLAWLAAALDLNYIARGAPTPRQRLTRHLWRMCAAFLIAAFSFFLGQQKVMPEAIQGSPLLFVPELLILGAMMYWIFRMRFGRGLKRGSASRSPTPGPAATLA